MFTLKKLALLTIVVSCLLMPLLVSAAPAAADGPSPINIFIPLHIDPPQANPMTGVITLPPGFYERTRDEILWLLDEAEEHGAKYTALFNGWYPQEALARSELTPFQALLDAGHEIGTHAHSITYDAVLGVWLVFNIFRSGKF